ncbi:hypothetical protein V8C43DRAFT_267996 [Trichoderma afarasin]
MFLSPVKCRVLVLVLHLCRGGMGTCLQELSSCGCTNEVLLQVMDSVLTWEDCLMDTMIRRPMYTSTYENHLARLNHPFPDRWARFWGKIATQAVVYGNHSSRG